MSDFNTSRAMVITITKELLEKLGRHFEITINVYLRAKYGTGLELIGENPRKVYTALKELFGDFAAKVFMYNLVRELNIPVESTEVEDLIRTLEVYLGEGS